jgi:hypothetical protein
MKILIKDTNKIESLEIIDPRTGINWIEDFVGNTGALTDGQFEYEDETGSYLCEQSTFDWWSKVVSDNEALENRIYDLVQEHGSDAVYSVVNDAGGSDLEDHAANVNQALDEAFGE